MRGKKGISSECVASCMCFGSATAFFLLASIFLLNPTLRVITKLMLHLAEDAKKWGRNGRFHHTFSDEDSMGWLKCNLTQRLGVCFGPP